MKKALMLLCILASTAQAKELLVTLKAEPERIPANFYIKDVIDARGEGESIGSAMRGMFNWREPVYIKGGVRGALLSYFQQGYPEGEQKLPVVVRVLSLRVDEETRISGEYALAFARMEFYVQDGDTATVKVYETEAAVTKKSMFDVTEYHERNIRRVLDDCIASFAKQSPSPSNIQALAQAARSEENKPATGRAAVPVRPARITAAEEPRSFILGLSAPFFAINGDFDGNKILYDDDEAMIIPRINSKAGMGIVLGLRDRKDLFNSPIDLAGEFSYAWSSHDATWLNGACDVSYSMLGIEMASYFNPEKELQPFLSLGMNLTWLTVKNGAVRASYSGISTADAKFNGYGISFGTGLAYVLRRKFVLSAGLVYNWSHYTSAEGASGETKQIKNSLDGSAVYPVLKAEYLFSLN